MRLTPIAAIFLLVSGCSQPEGGHEAQGTGLPGTVPTTLEVAFSGQGEDVDATVDADLSTRPALPRYGQDGEPHPDFYSAHDQLVQWSQESGMEVEVQHSSFGYYLSRIGGVPEDTGSWYWSLSVNGTESMEGMSSVEVHEGTRITWSLTAIEGS